MSRKRFFGGKTTCDNSYICMNVMQKKTFLLIENLDLIKKSEFVADIFSPSHQQKNLQPFLFLSHLNFPLSIFSVCWCCSYSTVHTLREAKSNVILIKPLSWQWYINAVKRFFKSIFPNYMYEKLFSCKSEYLVIAKRNVRETKALIANRILANSTVKR